jgi:RNA polymerase sigma-70 factor (ECF subfamily)
MRIVRQQSPMGPGACQGSPAPARASSDAGLLTGIAGGDAACFEELYRRHVSPCRRRARQVLAGEDWVQDVVQVVFMHVWVHAGRFDARVGGARAWLLQLTHHKAVDLVRSQQRHIDRSARDSLLSGCLNTAPAPDQAMVAAEKAEHVRREVAALSAVQRDAVYLYFLCGLSQDEAARQLGVPVGTVKTRAHRGVVELRKRIDRAVCQDE